MCNVIELFDVQPHTTGFTDKSIRAVFPKLPPMVGFAATATCRTAAPRKEGDAYHHLTQQVDRFGELSGPAVVVFQDLDAPPVAATFGEIMCTTCRTFGAVGLITNGPGRDLDQVERLSFPVFTDGAVPSHGFIHILDVHTPVRVGGLTVYPDDLIHADLNGVAVIPRSIADRVPDAAAAFVVAEQIILSALHEPGATVASARAAMAEADAVMDTLRKKLRS
ncbi:MAG: RraA family protein [Chloroflexi bacterium]|nr:RraA family protein [Chloroflexota bacterium]